MPIYLWTLSLMHIFGIGDEAWYVSIVFVTQVEKKDLDSKGIACISKDLQSLHNPFFIPAESLQ